MATHQTLIFFSDAVETLSMLEIAWNSTDTSHLLASRHVQSFRNGRGEGLSSTTFSQKWGLSFTKSHKTRYVCCSHRAGQLSNLHSLAKSNRKSDILVWMWFFGEFSLSLSVSVCVRGGGDLSVQWDLLFHLFFKVSGAFGSLNVLENSWNFAHRSEPTAIRARLKLVAGRGRGARQRPLERGSKTWSIDETRLHELTWNSVHISISSDRTSFVL